jgi:peptide/nickel transport system permease protein
MLRFVLRRLAWSLLVLWFVVTATFAINFLLPSDPARAIVGPHGGPDDIAAVRKKFCLDRGFLGQYGCHVGRVFRGDLGISFRTRQPVAEIIGARVWPTAQLALGAVFLQVLLGVPLGLLAAVRRDRPLDFSASTFAVIGQSAPTFFLGPLFMTFAAHQWGWFPVSGYGEPGWDRLWHLFLPALTLAVGGVAYYARLVRGEMIEVLQEDYVRTARAKGLPARVVVLRHAFRNAMVPVVTLIGLDLGVLMGGAIVTEYIFGWPGLGREAVTGILNQDLPIVLGVVLLAAVAILAANLIVDLIYAAIDPRIRLE